ncbi:MAG: response regulator [Candidatus Acidiferrales bacterium]
MSNHAICDEAINGLDAVHKAIHHRPDVIILDLSMPVLNGLEAAAKIAKLLPEAAIILFTAYAETFKDVDTRAMGITKVVSKDDPDLVKHIEELLVVA